MANGLRQDPRHPQDARRLVFDLEALEHSIRLFDPDAQLSRAKPVPSVHAAFKGEMRRDVLAALRAARGQLTSLDIAERRVVTRKQAPGDVGMVRKGVGGAAVEAEIRGLSRRVPQEGDYKGWRVTPLS